MPDTESRIARRSQAKRALDSTDLANILGTPWVCAGVEMRRVFETVARISCEDVPVLLTGETGVGKDIVAQAIHKLSRRADKDCAVLNCSALEDAGESAIRSSPRVFTGAVADTRGVIGALPEEPLPG